LFNELLIRKTDLFVDKNRICPIILFHQTGKVIRSYYKQIIHEYQFYLDGTPKYLVHLALVLISQSGIAVFGFLLSHSLQILMMIRVEDGCIKELVSIEGGWHQLSVFYS